MAGRFLCARAPKCRRGYVGAPLCAQSGSGLRVLASRGRAVPRWGGPNWPFAPNGYSRAAKARGPRCASALARSEVWPAGGFGAGGCLPGCAFLAFGLRPRRCAAHFPPSGHVIQAPVAGLAGPRAAKPQLPYAGRPVAAQTAWPEPPNCATRAPRRGPKAESAWWPTSRPV